MNEAATQYWDDYWKVRGKSKPSSVNAWQFGSDPNYLAQLVIDGLKTATCSGLVFYEHEQEPLPCVGNYNIVLNSEDNPVAIIQTVDVQVLPMNEVSEEFAIAEGEGDRTYRYWWDEHERFFKKELVRLKLPYTEDMKLVCERFTLIDVK
ncbi:ASCH domain-containing protein [Priestia koreensis]|uniref:ASCH domain-containing protein n=1 Tax=Priestia koreensis TaxID=284581 RepID=UPI00203F3F13|nr:ASCH domain-containing protein [Priestia koreensis]MCM3003673.1 ASCH domain-containing protein [Priestia koreensis]